MAFKASLSVLLGCQFGAANKLLQAAEKGNSNEVSEILCSKPQLAAYTGFNNSFSPLHRAAAGGYVDVCRSIIEPIKQRVKVAEAAVASGRKKISLLKKWQGLLTTVLNQRTSRSMTALMLACENGHAAVAAYLLREGADPLACDWVHMRNCMHYAAMGGQVDCLRLLCSVNTQVQAKDGYRALKDVVVQDIQVETCRFIDQRAFGGLTALHFAVVTGNLEAVQALLRGGASIMVKTDGEAYIGDEYLVPGSSPLHIAVIIGNISIVHAILQAHMENMNVVGQGLDERGRRPWEGSSRTDIRSVRNSFRKLPFHLARERGLQQLMSLVDPRIPIDVALDAARDTEHGIGPKRLSTIVSLVLQQSLLHWLDDCQDEIAKEATGHEGMRVHGTTRTPSLTSLDVPTAAVLAAAASLPLGGLPLAPGLPPAPAAGPASITVAKASRSSQNESGTQHQQPSKRPPLPRGTHRQSQSRESTPPGRASSLPPPAPPRAVEPPAYPIPAEHSLEMMPARHSPGGSSGDSPRTPDGAQALGTAAGAVPVPIGQPLGRRVPADMLRGSASTPASPFGLLCGAPVSDPACPYISQSAPVSPALGFAALAGEGTPGGPASQRLPLTASVPGLLQLHSAQEEGSGALHGGDPSGLTRMNSLHAYMGMLSVKRSRTVSLDPPSTHFPHGRVPTLRNGQPVLRTTEGQALATSRRQSLHRQQSLPVNLGVPANVGSANSSFTRADNSLTEEVHDRTVTVVSGKRSIQSTPTIRGMLTSIRERLRSSESIPVPLPASLLEEKDKDLASEPEPPSPTKSDDSEGDVECGICLDHVVEVAFSGCEHSLCLDCARNLTKQDKKPPHCPFCRRMVVGFMRVSPTRHPVQMR